MIEKGLFFISLKKGTDRLRKILTEHAPLRKDTIFLQTGSRISIQQKFSEAALARAKGIAT